MKVNLLSKETLKTIGKTALTTVGVTALTTTKVFASDATTMVKSGVGYEVWVTIKYAAMFIFAAFTLRDIIMSLNDGDYKDILKIMFKYGIAYACVCFLIKYFTWIDQLSQK